MFALLAKNIQFMDMNFLRNFLAFCIASAVALAVSGCGNYRLAGTPQPLPFSTIYVKPVVNRSYAPQATQTLSAQVANMLAQSPNLRVSYESDAEATLAVEIADYKHSLKATREDDTALGLSYEIEMTCRCSLLDNKTGKYIFRDKPVVYKDIVYLGGMGDLIGPEYQNMPILARGMARRIADEVLGIW